MLELFKKFHCNHEALSDFTYLVLIEHLVKNSPMRLATIFQYKGAKTLRAKHRVQQGNQKPK